MPRAIDTLRAGAYRRPYFGPPTTAMQGAVDAAAQADIDRRYTAGLETIEAGDRARGDPRVRAIEAQELGQRYEEGLPYGSQSRVMATYGRTMRGPLAGTEVGSEGVVTREPGIPTIGQVRAIETAAARDRLRYGGNPKERMEAALDARRANIVDQLDALQQDLDDDVAAGRRSRAAADAFYAEALGRVQPRVDMLKGGFPQPNLATELERLEMARSRR